ncbi:MAG: sulfite exporter TauE/SafE family protein [Nitrospirota bacterium]
MQEIFLMVFLGGLTGGAGHCIMMCGPVVVSYSMSTRCRGVLPHLLYNAGRVSTYAVLGGVMGLLGSYAGYSQGGLPFPRWLQSAPLVLAGVLIILMGLSMAGLLPFMRRLEEKAVRMRAITRLLEYLREYPGPGAFYPLGLVLGLIPCGLVYSALLVSARAGMESPGQAAGVLRGAALMLLFGAGTAIPLLAFGSVSGFLGGKMRARFYRLSAIIVIAMGVLFLYKGLGRVLS